ncbi:hypothetical protein PG993_002789 [Apiospora rasikravindrae]|uniref:ABM domain-containing protein n=1 Tax=Apiospora rasikravindrae TaxID=990691 RepID=A0ABR1TXM9_9PEZI
MPVTELAYLPLLSSNSEGVPQDPTPAFLDTAREVLRIQDGWCAENLPSDFKKPPQGVGLFVQVDNSRSLLLTAHWDSTARHGEWIQSQANQDVLKMLTPYVDMPRVSLFHVDGVDAFTGPNAKAEGENAVLSAKYVSVSRFRVAADKKAGFERAWAEVGHILQAFVSPFVHRGGWRIEKQEGSEDQDEFVLIGGWDNLAKHANFVGSEGYAVYYETIKTAMLDCDTRFYRKVL